MPRDHTAVQTWHGILEGKAEEHSSSAVTVGLRGRTEFDHGLKERVDNLWEDIWEQRL